MVPDGNRNPLCSTLEGALPGKEHASLESVFKKSSPKRRRKVDALSHASYVDIACQGETALSLRTLYEESRIRNL